jgi:hypothetical protein
MKEMSEQDQQTADAARARRKRIAEGVTHVILLLAACLWLPVFVMAVRTGYLSWIGITVGVVFLASLAASPVLGWTGRKHLAIVALGINVGMIAFYSMAVAATLLWPQGSGTWRPYRFDDELATIEAKRAVPDAENAARRYESVFGEMNIGDEPDFIFSGASLREELGKPPWKGSDRPQAAEWLDSQSKIIERLLEIGRMEKCRWPMQADIYDEDPVPYKKLRRSALLLMAAGNRDLGEGQVPAALTKYFCTLRIADHLHQQPSTIAPSFSYEREGLSMIRYVLVQSNLSDQDIAQIAGHLPPAVDPWAKEWERLLEFEKLHYMNLLGRLYEVNGNGAVRFAAHPVISSKEGQGNRERGFSPLYWLMSMPRDPRGVHGIVDRYFARFDHGVSSERPPQSGRHEPRVRTSPNDFGKATCNWYRWWAETVFFSEQNYMQPGQWRIPAVTLRRGTWLVLGLRRYRDAHGTWPQALDAISAYVPPEAFLDPTTGEAFVYVPEGDSFKLYSKGPNRLDDGGRRGSYVGALDISEDDIAIWPPLVAAPADHSLTEKEMMKQLEMAYGRSFVETYMKSKGSDKR